MITRKCYADNALNTIALQLQTKLPLYIYVLPNVITYLLTLYYSFIELIFDVSVNGGPRVSQEASEVQQLRTELLNLREKVDRYLSRLEVTSFAITTATVATDNDALPSDGQLPGYI